VIEVLRSPHRTSGGLRSSSGRFLAGIRGIFILNRQFYPDKARRAGCFSPSNRDILPALAARIGATAGDRNASHVARKEGFRFCGARRARISDTGAGMAEATSRAVIVAFGPGSTTDIRRSPGRAEARESLGQSVVVENKPGAAATSVPSSSGAPRPTATRCS